MIMRVKPFLEILPKLPEIPYYPLISHKRLFMDHTHFMPLLSILYFFPAGHLPPICIKSAIGMWNYAVAFNIGPFCYKIRARRAPLG
jgi:hypothetical protein